MGRADKIKYGKIVTEILPRFVEKLKEEKLISGYDNHPFELKIIENRPPLKINPDLSLHLTNGERVLVKVANPREPRRFLGEIVYPYFLAYFKQISKVIIFMLHNIEHTLYFP